MGADPKTTSDYRLREIFLAALEKADPVERAGFLAAACGRDDALRRRVEDLLEAQNEVGGFLESPALNAGSIPGTQVGSRNDAAGEQASVAEKEGDRIGRYKLLEKIGEGGCGVVYMAEQEEPVRRRVALKVIKMGMDTKSVIARFEAERQALAMMDHPNIARVFDAGATETGRPYFVMELVRGIKITDYCDQGKLSQQERLALLIRVCHAIQHAHQKGIIHRDIKPSNVLVTLHDGVPVPKVIDFGIAKATDQRLTDKTLFTRFHAFIGTPVYTSPEQAEMSGLDVDTRSDIYSLGVLLYELLTSQTPFDPVRLQQSSLDEMRRIIREEEPVCPSTRLSKLPMSEATALSSVRQAQIPALAAMLEGDLDWIVMKSLEKDRTRRYETASALASDLQRYLDNEPVLARPPSNLYRFQKFARRHRGAFAAAAVVAITLLVGASVSIWQAVRATKAEKRALTGQQRESHLRRQAEQDRASARLNEYVADINLAQQSLSAGNFGRAVHLLEKHQPQPGEPDLRGFEWRYLWQLSQGDEHVAFPNQTGAVHAVAFSPDGRQVVVGTLDRTAVYDAATRNLVATLPRGATALAFVPDGKSLIAACPAQRDNRRGGMFSFYGQVAAVRVWNTADWTERRSLAPDTGPFALSADGRRLATLTREVSRGWESTQGVQVWDVASWTRLRFLTNATGPMAFAPDGKSLLTDSKAGLVLWSLDGAFAGTVLENSTNLFVPGGPWFRLGGPMAFAREGPRPGGAVAFSPDGSWIVATRNTLSDRGVFVLHLWSPALDEEAAIPDDPDHIEHTGAISSLAFSSNGQFLATASMDYSVRLWDFRSHQRVTAFQGHLSEIWSLAFSPDGQSLISGAKDGSVKLWPVQRRTKEDMISGFWQTPLGISKDGRTLAAHRQGTMVFLNLASGEAEREFILQNQAERGRRVPLALALSDDLQWVAQSMDDGRVRLWNTQTRESNVVRVAERPVTYLALAPDGRSLVSSAFGQSLTWRDVSGGTSTPLGRESVRVLFAPDHHTLAVFQRSSAVELWDVATRTPRTNLISEVELRSDAAAFSPDGRWLALVGADDVVRLWNLKTCDVAGVFAGHKQAVTAVAFSPDGKTLATTSDDSTLKFWNVATQQELLTIRRLGGALRTLLFSPDGRVLVGRRSSSTSTGGLCFFRAPLFSEIAPAMPSATREEAPRQ